MARMYNGEEEIDTTPFLDKPSSIIADLDYVDLHINIKQGTKYEKLATNPNKAEEEYVRAHNFVVKNKMIEEEELKGKKDIIAKEFLWKDEYKKDTTNEVLPYRTIDVIFNKKNIYLNMQNPNPVGILYDIYNKEKWFSVLKIRESNNPDPLQARIWKQDIPAFYSFRNFLPYYIDEEIEMMKKNILSSVTNCIRVTRNQKNLNTMFKNNKELREILDLYLIFLELKELGLTNKKDHRRRINSWQQYVKDKMMNKIRLSMIPFYFNYANETLISSYIEDNCVSFLQSSKKEPVFIITCKIFQYPNRVLSVRVLISVYSKISQEDYSDEIDRDIYQTTIEDEEEGNKLLEEK
jgi:hypothetical protein